MNPLKITKVFNVVPKRRNFAKSGHTAPDTLTIIFTTLHLSHLSQSHIGTLSHLHTLLGRYSLAQFVYVPTPTLSTQKGLAQGLQKWYWPDKVFGCGEETVEIGFSNQNDSKQLELLQNTKQSVENVELRNSKDANLCHDNNIRLFLKY